MIVENRLRIFNAFLTEFPKDRPVTKYLPEYFKRNKQMGSRDRKNLSKAIYSYFRLGNCLASLKSDERLFVALFLIILIMNCAKARLAVHHLRCSLRL